MNSVPAIRDRLDALTTEALEKIIEGVEKEEHVKVTEVHVDVAANPSGSPALDVSVAVERA